MMMENEDGLTSEDNSNINALPQSMVTVEVIDKTSQKGLGKSRLTDRQTFVILESLLRLKTKEFLKMFL